MLLGKNNSNASLASFKNIIEEKIGEIAQSKITGYDILGIYYSVVADRHLYSLYVPKKPENSNSRTEWRTIRLIHICLLNKQSRECFQESHGREEWLQTKHMGRSVLIAKSV